MYHGAILISLAVKLNCTNALSGLHIYIHIIYTIYMKPLTNMSSTYPYTQRMRHICSLIAVNIYFYIIYDFRMAMVRLYQLLRNRILLKDRWSLFIYSWLVSSGQVDGWLHSLVGYANGLYIIDFYVDRMGK